MKKLFAGLMLLVGATAFAGCYDNSCCYEDDCCMDWCSGWVLSADYLYWRPTHSALDYVGIPDDPSVPLVGVIKDVCPGYDSGFRVALFKYNECNNWDFGVRYTYFCGTTKDTTSSDTSILQTSRLISSQEGTLNEIEGTYELDFNSLDVLGGFTHCFGCVDAYAHAFFGVKFLWNEERMKNIFIANGTTAFLGTARQKECLDAYGLTVGMDGRMGFCDGRFGITGRCAMSILHACFDRSFSGFDVLATGETRIRDNNLIEKIPYFEMAAGLDWLVCCNDCWNLGLEIGYEFHAWRGPDFYFQNAEASASTPIPTRQRAFMGLEGLYVRVDLGF